MVQISEAASLALHSMLLLAQRKGAPRSVAEMASVTGVSQAHLAKVLQRLHKAGLVQATRGPGGGYILAIPAARTTLLDVYEAIEGPYCTTNCLVKGESCPFRQCLFGGLLGRLAMEFREYMAGHTLQDLAN